MSLENDSASESNLFASVTLNSDTDIISPIAYVGIATALLVAFLIHKVIFRKSATNEPEPSPQESRLLRQQFGVIPDKNGGGYETEDQIVEKLEESEPPVAQLPTSQAEPTDLADGEKSALRSEDVDDGTDLFEEAAIKVDRSPRKARAQRIRERLATAAATRVEQNRPRFKQDTFAHPGLGSFWHWCDVETSLFRIFTITRKDGVIDDTTIPPYNPSSRRGTVPINIIVTNDLVDLSITVYWIDFKGKHIPKGTINPNGGRWQQWTWIDHPWIFCVTDPEERTILHYVPYKAIPTTLDESSDSTSSLSTAADATHGEEEKGGVHRFSISSPPVNSLYSCQVADLIFPHPASKHILTPHKAAEFALLHCNRMSYNRWSVLKKYVSNILQHPENPLCRQIRTSNPTFAESVWNTPARGILLAAGFIEHGAYVEFGSADPVPHDVVQDLTLLLYNIELWEAKAN
jgi:PUB domain/VHL beta domain